MARYDYRCRVCDSSFEVRRGITEDAPTSAVACPAGHTETSRVFSAVAVSRGTAGPVPAAAPMSGGGGCCGGACGCG